MRHERLTSKITTLGKRTMNKNTRSILLLTKGSVNNSSQKYCVILRDVKRNAH